MLKDTLRMTMGVAIVAVLIALFLQGSSLLEAQNQPVLSPAPIQRQGIQTQSLQNLEASAVPAQSSAVRGTEILTANRQGHFSANVEINGVAISTLVDTGATVVAFSAEDAERAGIRPQPSDFKYKSVTANGEVAIAIVKIRDLRLGSIELHDIEAAVLPTGALQGTLLGMSFLKRLALFQFEGSHLILRQ